MKISEIFYSIQGEGTHVGKPTIFIRVFDCNLDCSFCDEPLHKTVNNEMSEEEVIAEIANFPSKHVVITGGEPSLYNLNSFIQKLQSLSYYVAIETNGLHPENIKSSDWITYSPKGFPKGGFADFWSELKIVVNKKANIKKLLEYTQNKNFPVYIQPESFQDELNLENVKFCVELVKQYPHLRLSVQLHKALEER